MPNPMQPVGPPAPKAEPGAPSVLPMPREAPRTGPITSTPITSANPQMPIVLDGGIYPLEGYVSGETAFGSYSTPAGAVHEYVYGSAEALLWFASGQSVPILATVGPPATNGVLGQPGVAVLFGNQAVLPAFRPGVRLRGGIWFDEEATYGLEGSLFRLAERSTNFFASTADFPTSVIARPFFNTNPVQVIGPGINIRSGETAEIVSSPGFSAGAFAVRTQSTFWGGDVNYRQHWLEGCGRRLDLLAGYRRLRLDEDLDVTESVVGLGTNAGIAATVRDHFGTTNEFNGGQLGFAAQRDWGRWGLNLRALAALGTTTQHIHLDGTTLITRATGSNLVAGGALAVEGNRGRTERDRLSFVPEVTFNVTYQLTDHLKLLAGYNFLYWSNVVRPGDQIDRNIDGARIPAFYPLPVMPVGNRPMVPFKDSDFWAQGVNVGLQFTW
jgi:hypothetical protein